MEDKLQEILAHHYSRIVFMVDDKEYHDAYLDLLESLAKLLGDNGGEVRT